MPRNGFIIMSSSKKNSFPRPVVDGARFIHTVNIQVVNLNNTIEANEARTTGKNDPHINALRKSIVENGIMDHLPKIIVRELSGIELKKTGCSHTIVDGNHRHEVLKSLGDMIDSVNVDVWEFDDLSAKRCLQVAANNHAPALSLSEKDLANAVQSMIDDGKIKKDPKEIRKAAKGIATGTSKELINLAVGRVLKGNGIREQFISYTDAEISTFLSTHCNAVNGGRYDSNADMHGFHVKEQSEWRVFDKIIQKYVETNSFTGRQWTPSYIYIACLDKGTKGSLASVLQKKRQAVLDAFSRRLHDMLKMFGMTEFPNGLPIEIRGFIPQDNTMIAGQDVGKEDMTKVVPVKFDEDTLRWCV